MYGRYAYIMDILFIVIPAYNEESNIESIISQWYPILEGKGGVNSINFPRIFKIGQKALTDFKTFKKEMKEIKTCD